MKTPLTFWNPSRYSWVHRSEMQCLVHTPTSCPKTAGSPYTTCLLCGSFVVTAHQWASLPIGETQVCGGMSPSSHFESAYCMPCMTEAIWNCNNIIIIDFNLYINKWCCAKYPYLHFHNNVTIHRFIANIVIVLTGHRRDSPPLQLVGQLTAKNKKS